MLLTGKVLNKTIAKIDHIFTYDDRSIVNGQSARFIEFFYDDNNCICGSRVCSIKKTPLGLWCYYALRKNNELITQFGKYIVTYHELRHFLRETKFLSMLNIDLI